MMRRRSFLTLLGTSVAAWPVMASGQQAGMPVKRLGILMATVESDPTFQALMQIFRGRLKQLGWTDGDNLRIDYRWVPGIPERFRTAAEELVALKPDVILAYATPSVIALSSETKGVPIVFTQVTDPVSQGFVASLAHPGGNLTGFANHEYSLGGKWLSLLKDVAPSMKRVGLMFNPTTAPYAEPFSRVIEGAASSYGIIVSTRLMVQSAADIEAAITSFSREPNGGLIWLPDSFSTIYRERAAALAAQHRLPSINDSANWARNGGLIGYGPDLIEMYQLAASYVDQILRGGKASELPVQGPTKFVLSVNLKTARAIGLTISESFLLAADEVIE
jgi:putative tryptophan/tyrosine transport system substrate-binding protein